ncbi:MAG: hypothetical protein HKO07_00680 [Pseudomonadales bacterium]|nr:hypothetical protein [Pseudomonadales bacterium]
MPVKARASDWCWANALGRFVTEQALPKRLAKLDLALQNVAQNITAALNTIGFGDALAHCDAQANTAASYMRHMQNWFDAFRTMRYLHELRTNEPGLANVSETQAQELWRLIEREATMQCTEGRHTKRGLTPA